MGGREGWPLFSLMLAAPLVGVRKRWPDVLHAVTDDGLPIKTWPHGTARSACGLTGVRLLSLAPGGPIPWPVQQRLPNGWVRCEACHEATGRKRLRARIKENASA